MKLLTKEILDKATANYKHGSEFDKNEIIAKFFDPCGSWTWYLMNIDPEDPDYCWGIVKGAEVEMGSFSIKDLEAHKGPFGLGIERDIHFKPMPVKELWDKLHDSVHV